METWFLLLLLLPFPLGIADLSHEEMCSNNQLDRGSIDIHTHAHEQYGHAHGQDGHAHGQYGHAQGLDGHAHGQDGHANEQDGHAHGQDIHAHGQYGHAHGQDGHANEQDSHAHGHGIHTQGHHVLGSSLDTETQNEADEYYYIENPPTHRVLDVSDEGEVIMANKTSTRLTQQWRNDSGILINKQTGLALHLQQQSCCNLATTKTTTQGLSTWILYKNFILNVETDRQPRLLETDGLSVSLTFNHPIGTTTQKWAVRPVTCHGPRCMMDAPRMQFWSSRCPELFEKVEDIKEFKKFEHHIEYPECWEDNKPRFKLFTKTSNCMIADAKTELFDLKSCLALDELKAMEGLRKIAFITHGFIGQSATGEWTEDMANLIIEHDEDVAVVTVDWKEGASADPFFVYLQAAANTRYVGMATARIVEQLRKLQPKTTFHCIGHSLGAHVCGFVGKATAIDRISGMDPAGPLFSESKEEERLHSTDATDVDALHTDGDAFGLMKPIGHIDFYAGKDEDHYGKDQKGCDWKTSVCDHSRSHEIYQATIAQGSCSPEVECLWQKDSTLTDCQVSNKQPRIGYWYQGGFTGLYGFSPEKDQPYC